MATSACAGLVPVRAGGMVLSEVDPGVMTSLAPFRGREDALSAALTAAHGVAFPAPNRVSLGDWVSCQWTGAGQGFLIGPAPDPSLGEFAAMTDQSDGWAVLLLEGARAAEVLARLVPVDLRAAAFPEGAAARSLCGQMTVSLARVPEGIRIMGFRSMAATLVHDIAGAMALVAARHGDG